MYAQVCTLTCIGACTQRTMRSACFGCVFVPCLGLSICVCVCVGGCAPVSVSVSVCAQTVCAQTQTNKTIQTQTEARPRHQNTESDTDTDRLRRIRQTRKNTGKQTQGNITRHRSSLRCISLSLSRSLARSFSLSVCARERESRSVSTTPCRTTPPLGARAQHHQTETETESFRSAGKCADLPPYLPSLYLPLHHSPVCHLLVSLSRSTPSPPHTPTQRRRADQGSGSGRLRPD